MRLLDASTAEDYLRRATCFAPGERVRIRELTGGVSNLVLLVERPERPGADFVLKQARAQLRTEHRWFSSVERIWREAEVLALCQRLLESTRRSASHGQGRETLRCETPQILFEDRPHYLFAMTAAPSPHFVWKSELLAGRADEEIAAACGRLLGSLHAASWRDVAIAAALGDRTLFDELRVDPYYRTLRERHPQARGGLDRLIGSADNHACSLVLGDFSPKNMLLSAGRLTLVDFETGHYGDPAFDLGFFLSHLVLKACLKAPQHEPYLRLTERFRQTYDSQLAAAVSPDELADLWARGVQHFAGCAWARLDGKSPVEYLTDESRRDGVRSVCREVLDRRPRTWNDVLTLARRRFSELI